MYWQNNTHCYQQCRYCSHIKCTGATCIATGMSVYSAVLTATNHIKLPQPDGHCSTCQVHFTCTPVLTSIWEAWHEFQLASTRNNQISPSRPRKYESTSLSNAPQHSKGSQASPACLLIRVVFRWISSIGGTIRTGENRNSESENLLNTTECRKSTLH